MIYKTKEDIINRVADHYNWAVSAGYEVIGVFLQGSWNYGAQMSDEKSDVDTKCWILPSLEELALNKKPVSITHIMENGEHCDVKDVRLYMDCIRKQNVNFVEVLFTEYFVLNPKYKVLVKKLQENRELIAHYNPTATVNCMLGLAYQKQKALCHPYEGIKDKIEKYGYDGKQLSHAVRMKLMLSKYLTGSSYAECLDMGNQGRYLMGLKRFNPILSLDTAIELMEDTIATMKFTINNNPFKAEKNKEVDKMLNEFVISCFECGMNKIPTKLKDILTKPTPILWKEVLTPRNAKNLGIQDILAGKCEWDGKKIISSDGDIYSLEDDIVGFLELNDYLIYWTKEE